jgi:hypothetical protein
MLNVQEYLKSKSLDELHTELGIEVCKHDSLPLVILNYNQIESPKTHPVVRECRGLTLDTRDWSIVGRAFSRFFNWGEMADEMPLFNWSKATAFEKVDGSLILFYFFEGAWRVNTRGSFGGWPIFGKEWQAKYFGKPMTFTWTDGILEALGMKSLDELKAVLDPSLTYVCEFCSLWNKVVRDYPTPTVYNLSAFKGEEEVGQQNVPCFKAVRSYPLVSADDVQRFVSEHPESTFEGCVVKDDENRRWKIKNPRYLTLHKMKGGNGDALYQPKNIIPWVMQGDEAELLTYYPELSPLVGEVKETLDGHYKELESLWNATKHLAVQKDFALAIVGKTKLKAILFNARKKGITLKEEWRESADYLLKCLFE